MLKQGKQKVVFFFDREGDSQTPSLNCTPGDVLYEEYANADHGFQMEKKLESYKSVMMRSQNAMLNPGEYDRDMTS